MTLPTLVIARLQPTAAAALSKRRPDAIVVSVSTSVAAYRGHEFRLEAAARRILVALFANPGVVVSRSEMISAAYDDREDGGPEAMAAALNGSRHVIRFVCAMVGARLVSQSGGWSVEERV